MPDLSNKGSHQFWHDNISPDVYRIISFMEGVENWTLDGNPELEQMMTKLGTALDNIGNIDLQEEDKLIQLSCYLKMGRALRLLQCMDAAHPGAAAKILMYAESNSKEPDSIQGTFLQRNMVFERLRSFSRIFSEERFKTISKILGNEENHA